jgi:FkbM family methyltransferase
LGIQLAVPYSRRRAESLSNIKTFIDPKEDIVVVDVGANLGQSIRAFRSEFPRATIHSFEPSPRVFQDELLPRYGGKANVHLWNVAVGALGGDRVLLENSSSTMTSFLPPGNACWGSIVGTTDVPVTTLDAFAASASLDFVHVLKTDTQGFDLEVLRGAETLLANGKIGIIQTEVNLADLYEGQATFDSLYRHMADRDYAALGFYRMRVRDGLLGWMDALFIHMRFYEQRHRGRPGAIERVSRS